MNMNYLMEVEQGRSVPPMEIKGVNTRNDLFPFTALRVLGSLHIVIGVTSVALGAVDLIFLLVNYQEEAADYSAHAHNGVTFDTFASLTVASAPVWCGAWYVVTGSMGSCVSRERSHSLRLWKTAFLVLSVLCAVFFAPSCATLSGIIAIMRHTLDSTKLIWMASAGAAFLSVCEFVIAVISASVCCCCAPLRLNKVHVLFTEPEHRTPPTVGRHPFERDLNLLRIRPLPSPSRTLTVREMGVQTEPPSRVEPCFTEQVPRLHGQRHPRQTLLPHPYLPQDYPDSPPGSPMSYQQLKNWALPYDDYY